MTVLTKRNISILKIIVDEFIETWEVLGSKLLLKKYNLWVSPATVRNDMAILESLELIYQPYNSAWRLPTAKWLRAFINYLMEETPNYFLNSNNINFKNDVKTFEDFIYNITFELANNTKEIAFFISPETQVVEYNWIYNFLSRNYKMLWDWIFPIIKMLENKFDFINFIKSLQVNPWVNVFIWEENIISYLKDYTIILRTVVINWNTAYIWLIWTLKMNYSFNISAIRWII